MGTSRAEDLARIRDALAAAEEILLDLAGAGLEVRRKAGGEPVTEADRRVNQALASLLPRGDEGWLSEETTDDLSREHRRRVWVVDPLDGTKEFIAGVPEWCVSVGLVEDGRAVAGGICNPVSRQTFVGAMEAGVTLNGEPVHASERASLEGAVVVASRSEMGRGEWGRFAGAPFVVRPVGSVAYKLALVSAGLADATWTLTPKHEWDVAAGVALVRAAGGTVWGPAGESVTFNRKRPRLEGLIASGSGLASAVRNLLGGGGSGTQNSPQSGKTA